MGITWESARKKLSRYGQEHVLMYYEELTDEQRETLLAQVDAMDMSFLETCKHKNEFSGRGIIAPLAAMDLNEIEEYREEYTAIGLEAIRAGKVAAVMLAGGMGTRLGFDYPKGMYNIGATRELYIFECQIHNLLDVVKQAGAWVTLFIMTSENNHDTTVRFLKDHHFFGYREENVYFFKQEMAVATDFQGKIYLEEKGKISTSPNGNGGWFTSLKKDGLLNLIHEKGIEWINVFAVDNVLQKIADPCFLGATIRKNCASGAKVVRKSKPDEKVGVICLEDGRPSIVEYYEMTEEQMYAKDDRGEFVYNFGVILNYLFRETDLENMMSDLPLHIVEKKIPCLNDKGETIIPEQLNGYKYETLVLDMIHYLDGCLPFEVDRNREFAPIKNRTGVDSVETARKLLQANGVKL